MTLQTSQEKAARKQTWKYTCFFLTNHLNKQAEVILASHRLRTSTGTAEKKYKIKIRIIKTLSFA